MSVTPSPKRPRRVFHGWKRFGKNKRSGDVDGEDVGDQYHHNDQDDTLSPSPSNATSHSALLHHHHHHLSSTENVLKHMVHKAGSGGTPLLLLSGSDSTVTQMESVLRWMSILLLAYCSGRWFPSAYPYVARVLEYLTVAWVTCIVILLLAHFKNSKESTHIPVNEAFPQEQQQQRQQPESQLDRTQHSETSDDHVESDEDDIRGTSNESDQLEFPHPALEHFFVVDTQTGQRCVPNSSEPAFVLDNDLFTGKMMILIRTPDVDDPTAPKGTPGNAEFSHYFSNKQRRWEFQWQIRLKKPPEGKVYFNCELEEGVKMGVLQRAFVGAAMAFVKKMSNNFHYSITGSGEGDRMERPHMAFGVEQGMTRIIATKPGQIPPKLGSVLEEDPDHMKKRIKTGTMEWNTEDTYTLAFWTAYFDFLQWKSMNFPGIKPFTLTSVVGPQPISLKLYVMSDTADDAKHCPSTMNVCTDLEISNSKEMNIGPAAQNWKLSHNKSKSIFRDQGCADRSPDGEDSVDDVDMYLEEQTIAELGEGLYLKSGDDVMLNVRGEDLNGFVSSGGGFAVVQQNASGTIIIEKAKHRRNNKTDRSVLVRSGDVVTIKLLVNKEEVKYLSIHRGWWLKWVTHAPKKNGFFTIHTNETGVEPDGELLAGETQSSYITLGGTFWLRHKRWGGFHVGVRTEESATYGGSMLGLYESEGNAAPTSTFKVDDDDEPELDDDTCGEGGKWMKKVLFRALQTNVIHPSTPRHVLSAESNSFDADDIKAKNELYLTTSNCSLDVPVWIEMMHRSDRKRQLAYVVRVLVEDGDSTKQQSDDQTKTPAFCRIRSGKTLSGIIRTGLGRLKNRNSFSFELNPSTSRQDLQAQSLSMNDGDPNESYEAIRNPGSLPTPMKFPVRSQSLDNIGSPAISGDECGGPYQSWAGDDSADEFSDDGLEFETAYEAGVDIADITEATDVTKKQRKGRNFIDKLAESVKSGTQKTGMQVVRHSKKVGHGTVSAGKAIIAPMRSTNVRSKKPPVKEPKTMKGKPTARADRKTKRDLLSVNRAMKHMRRAKSKIWLSEPNAVAGQLSPPEQSLRTSSVALSRMSSAHPSTQLAKEFEEIVNKEFVEPSDLDLSFLQGGASQVGVVPPDDQKLVYGSLVARCLWESHWREEWCGIYPSNIVLFATLTTQHTLQLSYGDINMIRSLESNEFSPLPGYPILVIETGWQCHYLAFVSEDARSVFSEKLEKQIQQFKESKVNKPGHKDLLWKARFWQGCHELVEATHSAGNHKWAKVSSGAKLKHRSILNGRRMVFDVDSLVPPLEDDDVEISRIELFVSKLLDVALTTKFETLEKEPRAVVEFLDMTSQLKSIPLHRMDLSQPLALCIFTNIYHCLLQHSLILTINGPLHKKSNIHFMRTMCYEIGGDVFSLAELYHCVIRGQMSKPNSPKIPYLEFPKKSSSYSFYALSHVDPRISFVLNTGDTSCPQTVPILRPLTLDTQFHDAALAFVERHLVVDDSKRVIVLPKICDVYRNDFGDTPQACLLFLLSFLHENEQRDIAALVKDNDAPYAIKFAACAEQYHQLLSRLDPDLRIQLELL